MRDTENLLPKIKNLLFFMSLACFAQLANAQSAISSSILQQFANLQTLSGWNLASGTAGNTGATGSGGTSTFTANSDGSATIKIQPAGPYYDAFWFRPLAGTWNSRTLPPAPSPFLRYFLYHVEYQADSVNIPLIHALEGEARWYDGTWMFQFAFQLNQTSHTVKYYNWCATKNSAGTCVGNWLDTKIPFVITAGQWLPIDVLYKADETAGITTAVEMCVSGKCTPINAQLQAKAKSVTPWIHTSVQGDSGKSGAMFSFKVQNISLGWL